MRALLYHLGVLKWLAEQGFWDDLREISSVSGGSWCVGCVIGHSKGQWPSAEEFLETTLPSIREKLCRRSMLLHLLGAAARAPWRLFWQRWRLFSSVFEKQWGLTLEVGALPQTPKIHINATCFETGKRWSFTRAKMGDYIFGYSDSPGVSCADAIAASSGFPFLIGSVVLATRHYEWKDGHYGRGVSADIRQRYKKVHLWDGGVYENTGLESLFKSGRIRGGLNFLIVADAADPFETQRTKWFWSAAMRLLFIAMEQVRSLRARQVVQMFMAERNGFYAKIGKAPWQHLRDLAPHLTPWFSAPLSSYKAIQLSKYPMHPHRVNEATFDDMIRHGWQTCETIHGALFRRQSDVSPRFVSDPIGLATRD